MEVDYNADRFFRSSLCFLSPFHFAHLPNVSAIYSLPPAHFNFNFKAESTQYFIFMLVVGFGSFSCAAMAFFRLLFVCD